MSENKLEILLEDKHNIHKEIKELTESGKRASFGKIVYLKSRLNQINYKLGHFGQKYNIVCAEITFNTKDDELRLKHIIYLTDVTEKDAELYLRELYQAKGYSQIFIKVKTVPFGIAY